MNVVSLSLFQKAKLRQEGLKTCVIEMYLKLVGCFATFRILEFETEHGGPALGNRGEAVYLASREGDERPHMGPLTTDVSSQCDIRALCSDSRNFRALQ